MIEWLQIPPGLLVQVETVINGEGYTYIIDKDVYNVGTVTIQQQICLTDITPKGATQGRKLAVSKVPF